MVNTRYAEELELGISRNMFDAKTLDEFLSGVDEPLRNDKRIIWPDNAAFFRTLHGVLNAVGTKVDETISDIAHVDSGIDYGSLFVGDVQS